MSEHGRRVIRGIVLLTAAVAMYYGIYRGEEGIIFAKAARVCMECIGLG